MTATAQGRHCAACNNVVVDFTQKTDAEILALLTQASSTCGRFREDQLQRPLLPSPMPTPYWRTWLAATAAVLGLSSVVAPVAQAQQSPLTEQAVKKGKIKAPIEAELVQPELPLFVARGIVFDSTTQEPLPGVTVLLAGTTIGTSTNEDGYFELALPNTANLDKPLNLQFTSIGYMRQDVLFNAQTFDSLTVTLVQDARVLGEVITVGGYYVSSWRTPRSLWQRLTKPFRN